MAGAGYKLFNTGDVLTAAQVNTYLQEQTIMVFDDAAARTSALSGVVAEGMVSYLKDTDAVEKYDGSSWVSVGGAGLTSPLTTKGDIWGYSTTDARIPVGADNYILTADSTQALGVKWAAAASGGGMTLLSTTTLSGASTTITVTGGYNDVLIIVSGVTYNTADEPLQIRPNASSSLAYGILNRNANGTAYANVVSDATINTLNDPKRTGGNNALAIEIKNYATSSYYKPYKFFGGCETASEWIGWHSGGFLKTNSAITSFVVQTASGYTLTGGQVLTYGVK